MSHAAYGVLGQATILQATEQAQSIWRTSLYEWATESVVALLFHPSQCPSHKGESIKKNLKKNPPSQPALAQHGWLGGRAAVSRAGTGGEKY